ncbi:MAG: glycosyltransferase family 8 protein [Hyphomonas sp.]
MDCSASQITIAFGVDLSYAPHMATAIASIVANNRRSQFHFIVIHDGIPLSEQNRIESVAPGHKFDWPLVTDTRMLSLGERHHLNRSTYYRFAIPELVPASTSRVIYLDSDLVALADIEGLWTTDLSNHPIGAIIDPMVDSVAFANRWGLKPKPVNYFNAGVLVMDLDKIRASDAFSPAFDLLANRWDDLDFGDQCILNILFWNNWKRLDPVWNVQRCMVMIDPGRTCYAKAQDLPTGRRPKIVHYTEHNKPWSVDAHHPFTWMYYKYLRRTPFWSEVNLKAQTTPLKHVRRYMKTKLNLSRLSRV